MLYNWTEPIPCMLVLTVFLLIVSIVLFASVFWIWMLVDCATRDPGQGAAKIVWILIILFTHTIGALLYFLLRRPRRFAAPMPPYVGSRAI